jgi:hypothetical protein
VAFRRLFLNAKFVQAVKIGLLKGVSGNAVKIVFLLDFKNL